MISGSSAMLRQTHTSSMFDGLIAVAENDGARVRALRADGDYDAAGQFGIPCAVPDRVRSVLPFISYLKARKRGNFCIFF